MIEQQPVVNYGKLTQLVYPKILRNNSPLPILNKTECFENSIFCGYSNGNIIYYKCNSIDRSYQYANKFTPYQNTDVIDIDQMDTDVLVTCTHNQVTLYNMVKNKSLPLKGHQSSPIAVSVHPVSPLVVSVSNAVITHDIRVRKPINVNFITPPAYDIQYFPDGKEYVLSGQPCRIGRYKWIRTLVNGLAKPSLNSKYVVTNDMNGKISLWDWRESEEVLTINDVKNKQIYQPVHYVTKNGNIKDIIFLQDNGSLLRYDILKEHRTNYKLFDVNSRDNWKMTTRVVEGTTKSIICYEHRKAVLKILQI